MWLHELAGEDVYEELDKRRPPSLGLPLVFSPPKPEEAPKTAPQGRAQTGKATLARSSGLPGTDRSPKGGAERSKPQGMPMQGTPGTSQEGY